MESDTRGFPDFFPRPRPGRFCHASWHGVHPRSAACSRIVSRNVVTGVGDEALWDHAFPKAVNSPTGGFPGPLRAVCFGPGIALESIDLALKHTHPHGQRFNYRAQRLLDGSRRRIDGSCGPVLGASDRRRTPVQSGEEGLQSGEDRHVDPLYKLALWKTQGIVVWITLLIRAGRGQESPGFAVSLAVDLPAKHR